MLPTLSKKSIEEVGGSGGLTNNVSVKELAEQVERVRENKISFRELSFPEAVKIIQEGRVIEVFAWNDADDKKCVGQLWDARVKVSDKTPTYSVGRWGSSFKHIAIQE